MKFTGHRLRYSTMPNVTTLCTKSSQAKIFAFFFFVDNLPWSLLTLLFWPQTSFHTKFTRHCTLYRAKVFNKNGQIMHTQDKMTTNGQQNIENDYKFFWMSASNDFGASHYEIQTIKMGFNQFWMLVNFQYRGFKHLELSCTLTTEAWLELNMHFVCRYLECMYNWISLYCIECYRWNWIYIFFNCFS